LAKCSICGKSIRFIKRKGEKALIVNANPIFFIPDNTSDKEYVLTNGDIRKGRTAEDGLRGFTLHMCSREEAIMVVRTDGSTLE
jgi:hypothetical protein